MKKLKLKILMIRIKIIPEIYRHLFNEPEATYRDIQRYVEQQTNMRFEMNEIFWDHPRTREEWRCRDVYIIYPFSE